MVAWTERMHRLEIHIIAFLVAQHSHHISHGVAEDTCTQLNQNVQNYYAGYLIMKLNFKIDNEAMCLSSPPHHHEEYVQLP